MDPLLNFLPQELVDKINGTARRMEMIAKAKAKWELHEELKDRLVLSLWEHDEDSLAIRFAPDDLIELDQDWDGENYRRVIDFWDKRNLHNIFKIWDFNYMDRWDLDS